MSSLTIIYASTSGHTEYVTQLLEEQWNAAYFAKATRGRELRMQNVECMKIRVEKAEPEDIQRGDVLVLASGTWNTGGEEGQLNPHMDVFLKKCTRDMDLKGKKCAVIGLGDERYRYTCKAADRLEQWIKEHGGKLICETLRIVNEPYGQEGKIDEWGKQLLRFLAS